MQTPGASIRDGPYQLHSADGSRRAGSAIVGCSDEPADGVFFSMADHMVNPINFTDFLRCSLGVAARYEDPGSRIGADGPAYRLARLHGGFLGDRAGIDNTNISLLTVGGRHPF